MTKDLIPRDELSALLKEAGASRASRQKVWFTLADRILSDWNGISYSFLDALTPGQAALVCCAQFQRGAEHDFLTLLTGSSLPGRTLKAYETLGAQEYLELLQRLEAVFPGGTFPEHAEDMLAALRRQPKDYFEQIAEKFATGRSMKQSLCDYVFEYIAAHAEDFAR